MRAGWIACLFGLLPLASGCTVARQISENILHEKHLFLTAEKRLKQAKKDAHEILKEISDRHPHKEFTLEFRDGFDDGFVDYLRYGGPSHPPSMPAVKYRTPKYLSPEGHCRVRDYFLGFQYGVDCAVASGRRQFYTLPILVTDPQPVPPLHITVLPAPPEGLSTETPKKLEPAPVPKADQPKPEVKPEVKPEPPKPMPEPPKPEVKPEVKPEPPKPEVAPKPMPPKVDPPKPMPEPPKPEVKPEVKPDPMKPMPIPPVEVPKVDPPVKPPKPPEERKVPAIPTSQPPAIPLIPVLPSVSIGTPSASPPLVPVGASAPNSP